jgi:hypothetical protein
MVQIASVDDDGKPFVAEVWGYSMFRTLLRHREVGDV